MEFPCVTRNLLYLVDLTTHLTKHDSRVQLLLTENNRERVPPKKKKR